MVMALIVHNFETPRNIFEKLIRDYEQLDMVVNGDNMFNFVSTAFHMQEWIKSSPIYETEAVKRLVRKASHDKYLKICNDIICAKTYYKVEIDDPDLPEGEEPNFNVLPEKFDLDSYKDGSKKFRFIVGDDELDPFEFKEEIKELYSTYFKIK
jgi:hypothetical protein